MFRPSRESWFAAGLLVLAVLAYLPGLHLYGTLGPDEPRYASIGRAMARTGDWVTPRLWGEPWFEKPALLYWLVGAAYKLGFSDAWAPRLGVALSSLAFLAVYGHVVGLLVDARTGVLALGMLASSVGWLAYSGIGVTDVPLAVSFGAAVLFWAWWERERQVWQLLAAGACLGLAVLAKGLVPLVLILPVILLSLRQWRVLLGALSTAILVAAPWYTLCYARNGWPFIEEFFLKHHFSRFASGELQHQQPFWYYVPVLLAGLLPWSPLLALVRRAQVGESRLLLLSAAVMAWGLLFFSASANKLPGYVLPLFPFACVLLARAALSRPAATWLIAATAVVVPWLVLGAQVLPAALNEGLRRADWGAVNYLPAAVGLGLACGLAWAAARLGAFRGGLLVCGFLLLFYGGLRWSIGPSLEASASARSVWQRFGAGRYCLGPMHRVYEYGLRFHSDGALTPCPVGDIRTPLRQVRGAQFTAGN